MVPLWGTTSQCYLPNSSTTESLILRSGIFAVGGLIVDMDNPGIGLWNHTLPAETPNVGVWSQDVLWLEAGVRMDKYNLTDCGGFFNLTTKYPTLNRDGQNIDLWEHAFKGAALSNAMAIEFFNNLTRNESHSCLTLVKDLWYLQNDNNGSMGIGPAIETLRQGYGGADTNITNVAVHCYLLLAPPQRSDGGDPRLPADNSTWTQRMFSYVDLLWGRVPDSLDGDPSLWRARSDVFYIPAGATDLRRHSPLWRGMQSKNLPAPAPTRAMDYTVLSNFALLSEFQMLISTDPKQGAAQIQNPIWTVLMANNALGTASNSRLLVRANVPSIAYDLRRGARFPSALALGALIRWRRVHPGHRLVETLVCAPPVEPYRRRQDCGPAVRSSALMPVYPDVSRHMLAAANPGTPLNSEHEKRWAKGAGRTPVCIQPVQWDVPYSSSSTEFVPLSTHEK
ncbi:hypothetical protein B0H14DRAFT_3605680 [Mycena olivaceomarginata]|nr:hypothetical protein B0H14DRAFT_3605680 [Mycena olivaceomarginata]